MRKIRRNEHEVVTVIVGNRITDVALATAVHRERKFVLRMVMPFERDAGELAVVNPDRTPGIHRDVFVGRFHVRMRKEIV